MPPPLAAAFTAALGRAPAPADLAPLDAALADAIARARARWPGVDVDPEVFVRHVAERLPRDAPALAALDATALDDLWLAVGCLRGDPAALRAFEDAFLGEVGAAAPWTTPSQPISGPSSRTCGRSTARRSRVRSATRSRRCPTVSARCCACTTWTGSRSR